MRKCTYVVPKNLDEAISLHESYGDRAKYIAGGTDVLVKVKEGKLAPDYLISLKHILGQDRPFLNHETGELFIGAFIPHRAIEKSSIVQLNYPILHDAIKNIGSVQIRNVATIGGNLVNAVPSADGAIPLIALDAKAHIYGTEGHRSVELLRFFLGPGQCDLAGGEILLEIVIPRFDVPISVRGKYYVRTGSTLQELRGLALNEFILKRTGKTWDDIPEQRAFVEDIDETIVKQFLKDARIAKRMRLTKISSVSDYIGLISSSPDEFNNFIDFVFNEFRNIYFR